MQFNVETRWRVFKISLKSNFSKIQIKLMSLTILISFHQLQLGFCDIACQHVLDCSHVCGLTCHYRTPTVHNKKCLKVIESPCLHHRRELTCDELHQNIGNKASRFCFQYFLWHLCVEIKIRIRKITIW